jgi:hypothetical protein
MRKRTTSFAAFVIFASVLLITACGSGPAIQAGPASQPAAQQPAVQVIVGAEGVPQPSWARTRKVPEDPDVQYFIGDGRDGKTITARKNSAREDAARQLGTWKDAVIKGAIKDYVNESGETGNTQSLEKLEVASITRANANTSGFKEQESWIAADGHYVGLYSYPKANLSKDFQATVNAFVRNESAAFADFKADEAFRYLEQEMNNN